MRRGEKFWIFDFKMWTFDLVEGKKCVQMNFLAGQVNSFSIV